MEIDAITLKAKISDLRQAVLERHPRMPGLLQEIHKTIKQYPEQVTLLDEDDIAGIVSGLELQTGVYVAQKITTGSKSSSTTRRLKTLSEDDI